MTDNFNDERFLGKFLFSMIAGWVIVMGMTIPITFLHEFLHIVGTYLSGGVVEEIVAFNFGGWFSMFFYPLQIKTLGFVTSSFAQAANVTPFFMLPYIVLFPLAIAILLASLVNDSYDYLLILAGPIFYTQYVFFWNDFAGLMGFNAQIPILNLLMFLFSISLVSYRTFMELIDH